MSILKGGVYAELVSASQKQTLKRVQGDIYGIGAYSYKRNYSKTYIERF